MSASEASAPFDAVGEGAPVGLGLVDRDLRFVRINAALAAINGRPRELHLGRRLDEVLPGHGSLRERLADHRVDETVPPRKLEAAVRERCHQRLARFKQPSRIEVVDELPLTVTGKVQKGRLRGLERRRALGLLE